MIRLALWVIYGWLAFAIMMGTIGIVYGHSWYDPFCCNDNDCAPIPSSSVTATDKGWLIVVDPGDHPMVTARQTFLFSYARARESQDDSFHLCLYPTEHEIQCFYAPPFGV